MDEVGEDGAIPTHDRGRAEAGHLTAKTTGNDKSQQRPRARMFHVKHPFYVIRCGDALFIRSI